MLADLASVKAFLRITDSTQDAALIPLLRAADRAVKLWCKRDLETTHYAGADAEYPRGDGGPDLRLRQRPVLASPPGLTGTVAAGSAVVTALSLNAQTYLAAGTPVQTTGAAPRAALGAFPAGAAVLSVDSATQVTCTAPATLSGVAVPLVFGLRLYFDPGAFYGDGAGAFAGGAELYLGLDYALRRDAPGGRSRSGLLARLGGAPVGGTAAGFWQWEQRAGGSLSAAEAPYWPRGTGSLRVEYSAGLGAGAPDGGALPKGTALPAELTQAACMLVGFMRTVTPVGVPLDYEALGRQVLMQMQAGERDASPTLGTVLQLLRPYREVVA
jgi:hypothetical protein